VSRHAGKTDPSMRSQCKIQRQPNNTSWTKTTDNNYILSTLGSEILKPPCSMQTQ